MLVEAQVQTSNLEMPPSQTDIHVQTSFSDYMSEKEDTSSIDTEQQSKRSPSQLSEMDFSTLYPLYTDAEVQTLPVAIPPGNDWRSARLKAAAQVQTSNISLEKPVPLPQGVILVQPSKLKLDKGEELEAPLAIEEKSFPSEPIEIGVQTSDPEILEKDKWRSSRLQSDAQVQTSTIELLKKLSVLSQIETMESPSRTELLKKVSSLSVTDPHMQLQRKPSSLSESVDQVQVLNSELLKMRPSSAQVIPTSGYEPAGKLQLSTPTREVQVQTSDLELLKKLSSSSLIEPQGRTSVTDLHKYSSLSLVETMDGNQEEVIEGRDYLITPQIMEAQIRKWYHEFPEVQIASQAPVQREPLVSLTVDSEVQTSSVEIPQGNKWRASRLQADAELQTSEHELAVGEGEPCHQSWNDTQTQTSLLEIWQARGAADAQIQTADFDLARTETEVPPPLVIDSQVQTSSFDISKAEERADVQTQTSVTELPKQVTESPPTEQIERQAQTSFLEIWKAKEPDEVQEKKSEFLVRKEENSPLHTDVEVQTSVPDMWREKEKADRQAQTSLLEIPAAQEELPQSSQTDAVVQTSDVEIPTGSTWRASRLHTDVQLQTSMLDMKEAELESPPPSQMDSQVQTSLLDIWRTKDLRDSRAQTSQTDVEISLEEPPLPPQPEDVVQFPTLETDKTPPPSQLDSEAQTSFPDIWKAKEVSDSLAQTSEMDMSESLEEPPLPSQSENVVQLPTPETTKSPPPSQPETEAQTSFIDIWKAKELGNAQIQTSQMDLPKSMEDPLLQSRPESPVQIATPESQPPEQLNPEKQTSLLEMWKEREPMESFELPKSSPSPTGTRAQSSQLDLQTLDAPPSAQMLSSKTDLASATPESTVPASPVCLPTSASVEAALPAQTQEPISLLEVWSSRQEAEVQKQTADLGLPFDEDSPLFPMLLESQEEKRPEQMSSVEKKPKPPLFTEAQVQTSFVEIPKGKKWRTSRLCTEAQVQTSFPDLRVKDRIPALQKMVSDHVPSRRVPKGPKRAAPVSVHLHVKMSPKRRTSIEKK
ncbi:titin-like [Eublepharis macularius]|uniref:Titin-like n=1 Tax=Eublepharis macularius TaxID=481883 RepID=A0AA97LAF1_EUBMA|nr:titin-like [Eublepharis macularius]